MGRKGKCGPKERLICGAHDEISSSISESVNTAGDDRANIYFLFFALKLAGNFENLKNCQTTIELAITPTMERLQPQGVARRLFIV